MVTKTRILLWNLILFGIILFFACQQRNDVESAYSTSDTVKSQVKYVNFTLKTEDRLRGVNTLVLESTGTFDDYYYGYDASSDAILDSNSGLEKSDFTLSNENADLSIFWILDTPSPKEKLVLTAPVFPPFSDGQFPDQRADPFIIRAVPVSTRIVQQYDGKNTEYKVNPFIKWQVDYDTDGLPTSWQLQCIDPSVETLVVGCDFDLIENEVGIVAQINVSYESDPRTYSDNYLSSYTFFNASGSVVGQKKIARSGDENNHSLTESCLKADGSTLTTDYCYLSDGLVSSAARAIETTVLATSDSSPGGVQIQINKIYYDQTDAAFYRLEKLSTYENNTTRQITQADIRQYSVDQSGAKTLEKHEILSYTKGFLTKRTTAQYSLGPQADSSSDTYQRDDQGRITDYLLKDASGDSVLHTVFTFNDDGQIARKRSYDYTNSVQNDTPVCGENLDYEFSKDFSGNTVKIITNYCNGATYQAVPFEIVSLTYDSKGLLTSRKVYKFSGTTSYISERVDYEYDDYGFNTKIQYYEGVGNAMMAAGYTVRQSDDYLFLTTEKNYNSDGNLVTSATNSTSLCTASSLCYSATTYTYQ